MRKLNLNGDIELSVIVPFVNEWPQACFTLASIAEELRDRVKFEIIAVDNWCEEVAKQDREPDRCHNHIAATMRGNKWLKVIPFTKKLSHWGAKRVGVEASSGKFLWFCDAHCIVSRDALFNMFQYYKDHHEELNGSIHLPLTYHILEYHKLIYKLRASLETNEIHYSFTPYRPHDEPFKVPCMSTCGMMVSRALYDKRGGWPEELGIYGGGENFWNFTSAVLGENVWIMPENPLRHHGDRRGYHWNDFDHKRNKAIATYLFGGREFMYKFVDQMRAPKPSQVKIKDSVLLTCYEQRQIIKDQQVTTISDWVKMAQAKW